MFVTKFLWTFSDIFWNEKVSTFLRSLLAPSPPPQLKQPLKMFKKKIELNKNRDYIRMYFIESKVYVCKEKWIR